MGANSHERVSNLLAIFEMECICFEKEEQSYFVTQDDSLVAEWIVEAKLADLW